MEGLRKIMDENSILTSIYFTGTDPKDALLGFLWDDLGSAMEYIIENGNEKTHKVFAADLTITAANLRPVDY